MEALGLVPPEIMRYVIARSKVNRHIDFDTGGALFETADEYERLVANPPSGSQEGMSKRQRVAMETQLGAIRLSQVEMGGDPADSIGGVSFRHLAMLAQIKSSDEEVWGSLQRSGHLVGEPSQTLSGRLARMRTWVGGPHFPEGARIEIQTGINDEARASLSDEQGGFIAVLAGALAGCEWGDKAINDCIREVSDEVGIAKREAYVALYWVLLGRSHGPRVASIIAEMGRGRFLSLLEDA